MICNLPAVESRKLLEPLLAFWCWFYDRHPSCTDVVMVSGGCCESCGTGVLTMCDQ